MTLLAALELSLLAVCIWGFVAVLLTAQFSAVVIIGCIAALIAGNWLRRNGWRPSPLATNVVAILVFIVAGGIMISTLNLLTATVYLFLFLQVTKYITRQNTAENRWCYVISLFNIIGASVITTTVAFGVMLVIYTFLILVSLRLFVIALEWEKALTNQPSKPILRHGKATTPVPAATALRTLQNQRVPRGMYGTGIAWTVVILLLASALFSAVPRLATQNLFQTYGAPDEDPAVSAFSETVEFGAFTEIQQDDTIALFVQPLKRKRPTNVRMRGVALDTFDGKAWKRTGYTSMQSHTYDFRPIFTTRLYDEIYTYRVIQPAGMTNFLFGDSFPLAIRLPPQFSFYADRMAQSIYLTSAPPKEFQYEVDSMHEDLTKRRDPATRPATDRPAAQLAIGRSQPNEEQFSSEPDPVPDNAFGNILSRMTDGLVNEAIDETSNPWSVFLRDIITTNAVESTETGVWEGSPRIPNYNDPASEDSAPDTDETENANATNDTETSETDQMRRARRWGSRYGYGLRMTGQQILHRYLTKCLALPDNLETGRVPELAQEWTEDAETTFAKAIAVERRLRTEFGYSLTPQARGNYIDSFLFDVREGHCEYFATSMAVLLRNIGIPARVVNGFYSSEWNTLSGNFTVRQKDAHSWVEAWLGDSYGWMTFDPTPPGGVTRRANRGAFLEGISRLSDAARMRWYRYVVDYSISDQTAMVRTLLSWRQQAMQWLNNRDILGISADGSTEFKLENFAGEPDLRVIASTAAIIMLLILWQTLRWIQRRRRSRWSSVRFYDDLLRLLSRRGIAMGPGQTPLEFARHVAALNAQWAGFVHVTQLYYGSRYRNVGEKLEAEDVETIAGLRKAIKQMPKQRKIPAKDTRKV